MAHFVQPTHYKCIGSIKKIKGLMGDIVVALQYPEVDIVPEIVFINNHHTYIPYRVKQWKLLGKYARMRLCDVADRSGAEALHGYDLFVDATFMDQVLQETDRGLIGYEVHDVHLGHLGKVMEVEQGLQTLLCISYADKELLVPMHGMFIKAIDKAKQSIHTELPPGYIKHF